MERDVRTADKLYDGVNETMDDRHMWLAPFNNYDSYYSTYGTRTSRPNALTFTFEKQICIGAVKFWNYGKTPVRGAREVELSIDELVIYRGYLRIGDATSILFTGELVDQARKVHFDTGKI
jgi:hypothetical protein